MSMQLQTQVKPNSTPAPSFMPMQMGLQRKCTSNECAERRKKQMTLQRSPNSQMEPSEVPPIVHQVLRSPGQPLDPETCVSMERRFGHDFSQVRVHTDAKAAESARAVDAFAYTVGRDVVFERGEYAIGTNHGRRLLAHELAHVAQQQVGSCGLMHSEEKVTHVDDAAESEANAVAESVVGGNYVRLSSHCNEVLQCQKRKKAQSPVAADKSQVAAEDVAGIIAEQMQMWYTSSRFGLQNASLGGDDEAAKWFLVALGGNLVWAATAFVAPEAVVAIRIMSVGGATVGSGTIEKLAKEDLPVDDFRTKAIESLSQAYKKLIESRPQLTSALQAIYVASKLTARNNAQQAEQRRKVAWQYLFRDTIGYMSPAALESNAKSDIEAIWKNFLPCYRSLHLIITPNYITKEIGKYTLACYYQAIVGSGVADRSVGIKKTSFYAMGGGEGEIVLSEEGEVYEFPGGATVTKTPNPRDIWWGNITAEIP